MSKNIEQLKKDLENLKVSNFAMGKFIKSDKTSRIEVSIESKSDEETKEIKNNFIKKGFSDGEPKKSKNNGKVYVTSIFWLNENKMGKSDGILPSVSDRLNGKNVFFFFFLSNSENPKVFLSNVE